MVPVVKIVTEFFMMVLSVVAMPSDVKEFRLDVIQQSGQVETVVVRRTATGFSLLQPQKNRLVESGAIRRAEGKKDTYLLKLGDAPEQTLDLAASLKDFSLESLRAATKLDLKASDGVVIHVSRSGDTVRLEPEGSRTKYACHR